MKRLITILLLLFTFASVDAQRAGWWYGNAPGEAAAGPDTLTLTYWNDFVLLHIANTGITEDANGVSQWQDRSGNGNHSTQTINANKPDTDVDGNVIFDGSVASHWLNGVDALGTVSAFTVFVISKPTAKVTASACTGRMRVMDYTTGGGNGEVYFYIQYDSTGVGAGNVEIAAAVQDSVGLTNNHLDTIAINTQNLVVIASDKTLDSDFRVNGVEKASYTHSGQYAGQPTDLPNIGMHRNDSFEICLLDGEISFIGIANRKFTPAEIATTESELNSFFTIY